MFDDKQIQEFRQIKAPETLRNKVLTARPMRSAAPMLRYAALAACLVFLVTVTVLFIPRGSGIAVTTGGQAITESGITLAIRQNEAEPAAYALARSVPASDTLDVPLTFTADGACRITMSSGEIIVDGLPADPGDELTADGELDVIWRIDSPNRDSVYTLVLHTDGEKTVLVMKYSGGWVIRLNEN